MPIGRVYRAQADLLIRSLPSVARLREFALKGGTAINLFRQRPYSVMTGERRLVGRLTSGGILVQNAHNEKIRSVQFGSAKSPRNGAVASLPRLGDSLIETRLYI